MHVRSLFLLIKPIVFFDVLVAVDLLLDLEVPFIQETYTKEVLTTLDTPMDEIEEPLMFMIELLNKFSNFLFFSCLIISVLDISPT